MLKPLVRRETNQQPFALWILLQCPGGNLPLMLLGIMSPHDDLDQLERLKCQARAER